MAAARLGRRCCRGCRRNRHSTGLRQRRGRRRLAGVGALLRTDRAVLFGQIAMRVAREVRQERRQLDLLRAVLHARNRLHIGLALAQTRAWPQGMVGGRAVAVGQQLLHVGDVLIRQGEAVGHHATHVQDVGRDGVHLLGGQRLGLRPRHRAVDVVPQRRQRRQLHQGGAAGERWIVQPGDAAGLDVVLGGAADDRAEDLVALAEDAMAGRALGLPDVHALGDAAGALGQALEIGPHVDVPGGNLLGRGSAAERRVGRRLRRGGAGGRQHQDHHQSPGQFTTTEHSSPRRCPEPTRSGWRCCDRSSANHERRATAGRSAAHSRCHRWHGSAPGLPCHPRPNRC